MLESTQVEREEEKNLEITREICIHIGQDLILRCPHGFVKQVLSKEWPCDAKFSEKCPCLHNNNMTIIKKISLFDTALVMTKTQFQISNKIILDK